MRVFTIQGANVKDFMQNLFSLETFYQFEVRGVVLHSFTYFEISGEKPEGGYCSWAELMPYVRGIIKGREKPRMIKLVFAKSEPESLISNAASLFINLTYESTTDEGDKITATTATSQRNFDLNRTVDNEWDEWVKVFFQEKGIQFT